MKARKTKSELIAWMNANPKVWEHFPAELSRAQAQELFAMMQQAGMYAAGSLFNYETITAIYSQARFARQMQAQTPGNN